MIIKNYKTTKNEFLKHLYSLDWSQQMAVNYTFGLKANELNMMVSDYMLMLIQMGEFRFRGKPVILISETKPPTE